ncbi:MAG: hypothetical protein KAR01_10665, partial [Desulfocapsa sp.]|nr:hypothetical protein [Desulfocapsa sp.]
GERILSSSTAKIRNYPDFYNHLKREKYRNLNNIGEMYKSIISILFWISLAAHLFFIAKGFWEKQLRFDAVMGLVILGGLISLISILTYVGITLWQVRRPLFSAYPLVLLYISFMFVSVINLFTSSRKNDT